VASPSEPARQLLNTHTTNTENGKCQGGIKRVRVRMVARTSSSCCARLLKVGLNLIFLEDCNLKNAQRKA
jgi:hypothetical protein